MLAQAPRTTLPQGLERADGGAGTRRWAGDSAAEGERGGRLGTGQGGSHTLRRPAGEGRGRPGGFGRMTANAGSNRGQVRKEAGSGLDDGQAIPRSGHKNRSLTAGLASCFCSQEPERGGGWRRKGPVRHPPLEDRSFSSTCPVATRPFVPDLENRELGR